MRPDGLLSVGELARRAGLTPKAVRHYDRTGLLVPHLVDDAAYRWYEPDQVQTAALIALLRGVDVPLAEVRRCLRDPGHVPVALAEQRRCLDARLARVQRQLHTLDHLRTDGLETDMPNTDTGLDPAADRRVAVALFNSTWTLMENDKRTTAEDDEMLHSAHASRYHWGRVGTPANLARGEWQCSRVYAVLGRAEPCLHHARRCLDICTENGIGDWDLAFAYEALARAHAVAGDAAAARECTEQALAAAEAIAEDEDRDLVLSDLESIPGQPRFW